MAKKPSGKRPNVLIIIVDNQWAGVLGCYGNTEHRTPQMTFKVQRLTRMCAQTL